MRKLKITEMGRMNAEEFKASEKMPLIVVLDDVRSMYNVGSVFRTADAFRVEAIYLCGITAQPPHPEIHKTALGAEDTVAWLYFPTALDAVHALKQQGYTVYSIEQCEGSTPLQTLQTLPSPSLQGGSGISANEDTNEQSNYSLPAGRVRGGSYFPSYEIMMDELRDYRFYADDMIHPSGVAVEYIWQRFQDTYFDNKTKDAVAKAAKEWRQSQHRQIVKNV